MIKEAARDISGEEKRVTEKNHRGDLTSDQEGRSVRARARNGETRSKVRGLRRGRRGEGEED